MSKNLFTEIINGNLETIEKLLSEHPEELNALDKMGRTLLMEAVIQNQYEICSVLINHRININSQEQGGWSALHFAAQEYSTPITDLLLKNGAVIDIKDNNGNTPLFRALFNSKGNGDVIKLLLQYGANKDEKNNSGISPISLAKQITNFNLIQFFE